MSFTLPTHCFACGALLMGGATRHQPSCEIRRLIDETFAAATEWTSAECTCRTTGCGHRASSHIGGHCFECGRAWCWS